jgi:hypothetical protein
MADISSGGIVSNTYVVKSGDTLSGIAHTKGYKSWKDIYFHPDNQAFRSRRPNPNLIFPGDKLLLPDAGTGPSASAAGPSGTPGWTFDPTIPRKLNLFLTPSDLFRLDQIIKGPTPPRGDPLRDLERALKALGPAAKNSNSIDDLAKKVQEHIEIHAGDWTIKPDLGTIGKGLLELLKKVK